MKTGKSGEVRIEHELVLSDGHFVHLEECLDLIIQHIAQTAQGGSQRPKQAARYREMPISSPNNLDTEDFLQPHHLQSDSGSAAMAFDIPDECHMGHVGFEIDVEDFKLRPIRERRLHLGGEHTTEMAVQLALADLHDAGAFDRRLLQVIHQIALLRARLWHHRCRQGCRTMRHPGGASQRTERRHQQEMEEKLHELPIMHHRGPGRQALWWAGGGNDK